MTCLFGFFAGLPAVLGHQAGPRFERYGAGPVAVKRAVHVVRADVGDGDHLHVLRIDGADEHAAFVAGADHAHAHRVSDFAVSEVHGTESGTGHRSGGDDSFEEIAARHSACVGVVGLVHRPEGFVIVVLSDFLFFRRQVHEFFSCLDCVNRDQ